MVVLAVGCCHKTSTRRAAFSSVVLARDRAPVGSRYPFLPAPPRTKMSAEGVRLDDDLIARAAPGVCP